MAFAQTFMVFILVVSFGMLAAVFIFWIRAGKLVDGNAKNSKDADTLDFAQWQTTLLIR